MLEDPPPSIDLFGFGPFMRWAIHDRSDDRHHGVDGVKFSKCWSPSKFKFRSANDFGCADWEWLLRWYSTYNPPRMLFWLEGPD